MRRKIVIAHTEGAKIITHIFVKYASSIINKYKQIFINVFI